MIQRITLVSAAVFGFLCVAMGAFGAHSLKPFLIGSGRMETFELAVRFQFFHVFALFTTGILMELRPSVKFKYASICFVLGIIFFSGSLYALCFTGLGVFGPVTPMGGILLIIGWAMLAAGLLETKKAS
jgi:uncharacterized membrane protein YgdD (TMEM256/DUF423 family)